MDGHAHGDTDHVLARGLLPSWAVSTSKSVNQSQLRINRASSIGSKAYRRERAWLEQVDLQWQRSLQNRQQAKANQ